MQIKLGTIVSNPGAIAWGVGKVTEVAYSNATIQFSDGTTRKIAASHYPILQPGDPAFFVPIPENIPVVKVRAAPKTPRGPKIPKEPKIPKKAKTPKQPTI
jgi:Protein of unknown function (DUF3553)